MRVSFADAGLDALDALVGIDALCLFVPEDQRPLRGVAAYADWRLCGALSRILKEGRFSGARGEALLFPSAGRLPPSRVFCFGAGRAGELTAALFADLARRACEAMTLAGSAGFATELPAVRGATDLDLARAFASEGLARFKGARVVLLGDAPGLAKAFQACGAPPTVEPDREPLGATAALARGPKAARG